MQLNVVKKIGNKEYVFQVEGDNLHAVLMEEKKLSFRDVHKCGLCESDWLYLTAYVTKEQGYEYAKVCCAKCGASVTFGKSKDKKDVYFLRKTPENKLDWQEDTRSDKKPQAPTRTIDEGFSTAGNPDEEVVPF